MLGILIDNAIEAVIINNDKVILFEIHKINNAYEFVIMNPNTYVDNEAILSWFDCKKVADSFRISYLFYYQNKFNPIFISNSTIITTYTTA